MASAATYYSHSQSSGSATDHLPDLYQQQSQRQTYRYDNEIDDEDEPEADDEDAQDDDYVDESEIRRVPTSAAPPPAIPTHSRPRGGGGGPSTQISLPPHLRPIAQAPPNAQQSRPRPFALIHRRDPTLIFNQAPSRIRTAQLPKRPTHINSTIITQRPSNVKRAGSGGQKVTLSVATANHEVADLASPDPNEPGTVMISGAQALCMKYTDFKEGMFVVRKDLTDPLYPPQLEPPSRLTPLRCLCCKKVYNGPNARSMWRRHITQKHNFTLGGKKGNGKGKKMDDEDDENISPDNSFTSREEMLNKKRKYAYEKRVKDKMLAQGITPFPPFDKPTSRPLPSSSRRDKRSSSDGSQGFFPSSASFSGNGQGGSWGFQNVNALGADGQSAPLSNMATNTSDSGDFDAPHSKYYHSTGTRQLYSDEEEEEEDDEEEDVDSEDQGMPALLPSRASQSPVIVKKEETSGMGALQSPFKPRVRQYSEADDDEDEEDEKHGQANTSNLLGFMPGLNAADTSAAVPPLFDDLDASFASTFSSSVAGSIGHNPASDFDFDISLQSEVSLLTSPVAQSGDRIPSVFVEDTSSTSFSEDLFNSSMDKVPFLPDTPIRKGLQQQAHLQHLSEAERRKFILSLESPTSYPAFLRSRSVTSPAAVGTAAGGMSPNPLAALFRSHTTSALTFSGSFLGGAAATTSGPGSKMMTSTPRRPRSANPSSTNTSTTGINLFASSTTGAGWLAVPGAAEQLGLGMFESPILKRKRSAANDEIAFPSAQLKERRESLLAGGTHIKTEGEDEDGDVHPYGSLDEEAFSMYFESGPLGECVEVKQEDVDEDERPKKKERIEA